MIIKKVSINDIILPEYNPREITDEELTKLKNSINEFGYVEPIILNDVNNHVVGGNQRATCLKELGYEEVDAVIIHEEDINREKALNIALNKISGEWDFEKLGEILDELTINDFNIELTGFDDLEVEILTLTEDFEQITPYEEDYPEYNEEPEDYVEVEGEIPNQTYSVIISFEDKTTANEFISSLGVDKEMKQNSVVINQDELEIDKDLS